MDNFFFFISFCVCADEPPSRSVHLPLGASHISMQHPLAGGPWSGSGIGPGGSGTPFLLDGGKVTLWPLAARDTHVLFVLTRGSFVFSFSQMTGTHTLLIRTGWRVFARQKAS